MSHFPANSVTYDWMFFAWRTFQPANAHSAQRSLACVALGKMSPHFKWIRGFAQVAISLRASRKNNKKSIITFLKVTITHRTKTTSGGTAHLCFLIWTYNPLMVFVMRREEGRAGTGDNYCFIDQKLMKKESLWMTHLFTPCSVCI